MVASPKLSIKILIIRKIKLTKYEKENGKTEKIPYEKETVVAKKTIEIK